MTQVIPDWVTAIPPADVHNLPTNPGGSVLPFTNEQLIEIGKQLIEQFLKRVVLAIVGSFIPGGNGAAFDQLQAWANSVSDALSGLPGIGTFLAHLTTFFGGIDFTDPDFDPVAAFEQFIEKLLSGGLLGGSSPLNSANLFGSIGPELLSFIPIGHIGSGVPNLLTNPNFESLASVLGGSLWSWDGGQGHNMLGSAKTIANGTLKTLFSNAIPVASGQQISLSSWVKWSGLAASGNPLQLVVTTYLTGTQVATQLIDSVASPASSGGWQQLTGTFTVPDGVDMIRQTLSVTSAATAGNVWFSDAALSKTGLLQMPLVDGLPAVATAATNALNYLQQLIDQVTGGTNNPVSKLITILQRFLSLLSAVDFTSPDFNPVQAWSQLAQNAITPTGLFATRVGGLIPLEQLPFMPTAQVPSLGNLMDQLVAGLFGFVAPGQTPQTTGDAMGQNTAMLAQVSAAVAKLAAEQAAVKAEGNPNVVVNSDDFERVTLHGQSGVVENAGPNWDFSYVGGTTNVGVVYCDGHQLSWFPLGSAPKAAVGRYIGGLTPQTVSDYQKISAVLGTPLSANVPGDVTPCYDDILGRMSADKNTYVRARIGDGVVILTAVVSGVEHDFHTEPFPQPAVGATGVLETGTTNDPYEFVITISNQEVFRYTDSAHVSQKGSAFRWSGLGMFAGQGQFGPQSTPGSWAHWLQEDNQPTATNYSSLIGVGQFSADVKPGAGLAFLGSAGSLSASAVSPNLRTAAFSGAGSIAGDNSQRRNFRVLPDNSAPPNFPVTPVTLTSSPPGVGGDLYVAAGGMTNYPTTTQRTAGYCRWNAGAPVKQIGMKFIFYLPAGRTGQGTSATVALGNGPLPDNLNGPLPHLNAHVWCTPVSWQYQLFDGAGTFTALDGYAWGSSLLQDGVTEHFLQVDISGSTATVHLPDGNVRIITDSRIASYAGNYAYDECLNGSGSLDGLTFIREDWFKT